MNTRNRRLSPFALFLMFCAALTFSLATAVPSKAQDSPKEFKPIGASPGTTAPVAPSKKTPPKKPQKDATDSAKSPDKAKAKAKPKATGVGASAGGTGSSAAKTIGGISLKKMLIIGASAVGVIALLAAGGGGSSTSSH